MHREIKDRILGDSKCSIFIDEVQKIDGFERGWLPCVPRHLSHYS
ncbi:MAG: hypothetical protein U0I22_08645 [Treponema sp.]|nr:hypothetical protein [Treponema sp.]